MARSKGDGWSLYGVYFGTKWWMTRNRRQAERRARQERGYVIEVKHAYGYGTPGSWDAPTFRVTGDLVADFRETVKPCCPPNCERWLPCDCACHEPELGEA